MSERKYVVVYRPPQGFSMSQRTRDRIMATGDVLEIRESSLYSLQFTEMKIDRITHRPLTVVLYEMADRYEYGGGGNMGGREWEPFEVVEVKDILDIVNVCQGYRYSEVATTMDRPLYEDPSDYSKQTGTKSFPIWAGEWRHIDTSHVLSSSERPREDV